ncbi:hypothetical protein DEO72_LG6g1674 [Vigna unguiculata]|uniref:Uncharacterized protein n=1 Tax=Vigna unguiculata TaxID=3917 RepID=A0A4D6MAX9_VIGUN|nr:hypothetical protein DEO72_LG6g1674 [Vigna unguiculata]
MFKELPQSIGPKAGHRVLKTSKPILTLSFCQLFIKTTPFPSLRIAAASSVRVWSLLFVKLAQLCFYSTIFRLTNMLLELLCSTVCVSRSFASLFLGKEARWRKTGILAQASGSRLSESIRNPPRCLRELPLRQRAPVLSKKSSCSSEEVLPKRESVKVPLFPGWSSRLGEKSSPERENFSRLSEGF